MTETKLDKIETMLKTIVEKIEELDNKVEELYNDYEEEPYVKKSTNEFVDEEEIIKHGSKVPYNKLDGPQTAKFRQFLAYIKANEKMFTEREYEYAGFADKTFSDIRLSDNARRILGHAYEKAYGKSWIFEFVRGYLYKLDGNKAWRFDDGTE